MTDDPQRIRVSLPRTVSGEQWEPVQGPSLANFLESNTSLSGDEKTRLIEDTNSILRRCVRPNVGTLSKNTGLVIGYVQSGKTLSFTSLIALAYDNDYPLIILLAGTTNNLVEQSLDRVRKDLGDALGARKLVIQTTRGKDVFRGHAISRIGTELDKWREPVCPTRRRPRPIVIVSMKHHDHISNLAKLFKKLKLPDVSTLIIDDEGDQAGMNTKAKKNEESTTHAQIKKLRAQFPHHSYLLYTATPQAPLLISRIDTLSPDFGHVLTPGDNYVGGQEFFMNEHRTYIKLIPDSEVPDKDEPSGHPPESLKSALRDFFVGVAIGLLKNEDRQNHNRSMMIHPAVRKDHHLMFARWVESLKTHWCTLLNGQDNQAYRELKDDFEKSTRGLLKTYSADCTFDDIFPDYLLDSMQDTSVLELNTREKSLIDTVNWQTEYSYILVGGIGLDRGFTVEGLTVSYMPRSTGIGNADNIQQRARFFGYKKSYLGLCRIYLTEENITAFTEYVKHEEAVRDSLSKHLNAGKTLKEWRRVYRLDPKLKPTRSSVIMLEMSKAKERGGWIVPDHPFNPDNPFDDTQVVQHNREIAEKILEGFPFQPYTKDGWNENQKIPKYSDKIPLADILPLIDLFQYQWPEDSTKHRVLMLELQRLVDKNQDITCSFYAFSGRWSGVEAKRTLTDKVPPKIAQLHQGANARTNYPGARKLHSDTEPTFQLYRYDLFAKNNKQSIEDVPILASRIPMSLVENIFIEH